MRLYKMSSHLIPIARYYWTNEISGRCLRKLRLTKCAKARPAKLLLYDDTRWLVLHHIIHIPLERILYQVFALTLRIIITKAAHRAIYYFKLNAVNRYTVTILPPMSSDLGKPFMSVVYSDSKVD